MSAYRVRAEGIEIPANSVSRFFPDGEAASKWDAITRVFYPGGVPTRTLPYGSYRVQVFTDSMVSMDRCETSIYRFN